MAELTEEQILEKLRKEVREWAKGRGQEMMFQIAKMGLRDTGELYNSIKEKVKSKQGMPEKVTFSFARHGIFQSLGVGRGTKSGEQGNSNRKAAPWINAALPISAADELAGIVANALGDKAVGEIKIGSPNKPS